MCKSWRKDPLKEDVASPITLPDCPTEIHVVGQKDFNQDTAIRLIAQLIPTIYFFDLLVLRIPVLVAFACFPIPSFSLPDVYLYYQALSRPHVPYRCCSALTLLSPHEQEADADSNTIVNMLEVKCHGTPYEVRKPLPLSYTP
jgi:hypothetical protein